MVIHVALMYAVPPDVFHPAPVGVIPIAVVLPAVVPVTDLPINAVHAGAAAGADAASAYVQ